MADEASWDAVRRAGRGQAAGERRSCGWPTRVAADPGTGLRYRPDGVRPRDRVCSGGRHPQSRAQTSSGSPPGARREPGSRCTTRRTEGRRPWNPTHSGSSKNTNYYVSDQGLPGGQELAFVEAAGMIALPPANYTMTSLADRLREYGPLWIIAGDGISSHARLLVGIYGNPIVEELQAYWSTVFEFIDPSTGTYVYERALDFMHAFEREAAYVVDREDTTDVRWQILHWPS